MTNAYFMGRLFQMCQEGVVDWEEDSSGRLVSQVNGVDILISGGEIEWTYFSVSAGFKKWSLREPIPHLSEAPLGKMINWFRKKLGLPPVKGPKSSLQREESEVRANMLAIRDFAVNQVTEKYKQDPGLDRIKQELLQQIVYGDVIK